MPAYVRNYLLNKESKEKSKETSIYYERLLPKHLHLYRIHSFLWLSQTSAKR